MYKKLPFGIKVSVINSGMTVITKEFPGNSTVHLRLVVRGGSIYDSVYGINGIQHVLEHIIFRAIKSKAAKIGPLNLKAAKDIARFLYVRGVETNGENSYLSVTYTADFHKYFFKEVVELMLKEVLFPRLSVVDLKLEKNIVCSELAGNIENPAFGDDEDKSYYNERLRELLYDKNPIRNRIGGRMNEIDSIKPAMIKSAFSTFYIPKNMTLIVIGPTPHKEVVQRVRAFGEDYQGMMVDSSSVFPALNREDVNESGLNSIVKEVWSHDGFKQAVVNMSFRAPTSLNKDSVPIRILSNMLGGAEFSPLWGMFRQKRAKSYYADAFYFRTPISGELRVNANLYDRHATKYRELIDDVQVFVAEEIKKIQKGEVDRKLFEDTKEGLYVYDRLMSLEGPTDVGLLLQGCVEESIFNDTPLDKIIRDSLQFSLKTKKCTLNRFIDAVNRQIDPDRYALFISCPTNTYP